jgi:DNA-binding NarL/FixJ family response regulator
MTPVKVLVQAEDMFSRLGAVSFLAASRELEIIGEERLSDARVVVLVADSVGGPDLERLRRIRAERSPAEPSHSVIVTDDFGPAFTITAAEYGVMSVLPRASLTPERLVTAVLGAANGVAYFSGRLQRALLEQLDDLRRGVLEPNGFSFTGLTSREVDVLQLIAEGRLTDEIGAELAYSEATVKNVLGGLCERLGLRNRTQAVAYAIKAGVL